MQPITRPKVLDPDRPLSDERGGEPSQDKTSIERLTDALKESCDYGQQLWHALNAQRTYLMTSLPPDPHQPGPHDRFGATPTGPDDEQGWQDWTEAYVNATSALCGPHGDSGFGLSEARQAATIRRDAPITRLHARHPELTERSAQPPAPKAPAPAEQHPPAPSNWPKLARTAVVAAAAFIALRGRRRQPN